MNYARNFLIKLLVSAATAAILLAATPIAALTVPRPSNLTPPMQPGHSIMIHQNSLRGFEDLTGQTLTSSDLSAMQRVVDQVDELNHSAPTNSDQPQNVRWNVPHTNMEFTVLFCGHLKTDVNALIPQKAKDILGKVPPIIKDKIQGRINQANVNVIPCFDPHTGLSYVMVGIGGTVGGTPSPLTAGISVGIYFSKKSANMVVGNYVFGRATMHFSKFGRWDAITAGGDASCGQGLYTLASEFRVDFSNCNRGFVSSGLGFDLGGALIGKFKAWKNSAIPAPGTLGGGVDLDLGVWSFSGGMIVKIHEYPWYERLRQGASLKETFIDAEQYIAKNN